MRPLTDTRPKHLLEAAGEPLLAHQLRWLAGHGVGRVVLATSHLADQYRPVLGCGGGYGLDIRYIREDKPLGTGGALAGALSTLDLPDHEPVVAVNGDLYTRHDLAAQIRSLGGDSDVVMHLRTVEDARPYGSVVADAAGRVTALVEKSPNPPSHEVNGGTYVLRRGVLHPAARTPASLETDLLPALIDTGRVVAYREQGPWLDVGTPAALVIVSAALVEERGVDAVVHPCAQVHPTARVTGGSSLGKHVRVGAGAIVRSSIVMAGATVGPGATVVSSVIGLGALVAPDADLRDAVVGDAVDLVDRAPASE